MSGAEIVIIIAGAVTGVISCVSNVLHYVKAKKNRRDIKVIKDHTKPQIVIKSDNGTLTPSTTPREDETELEDIDIHGRYKLQNIYYDTETNQYFETIPQTPRLPF